MAYTVFSQVLQWLQQPTGLTVHENRAELVEIANDVRRLFFNLYENIPMFLDAEECLCVHSYNRDCNACEDTYLGITLPEGMQTPEAMWVNSTPVVMNSKWRSYKVGIPPGDSSSCRLQSFDMGDIWPTALDLPHGECQGIKIKTGCAADAALNKEATLTFIDENGEKRSEQVKIAREYHSTVARARSLAAPGGIALPVGLTGAITVATTDGSIIAEVSPFNPVPSFRRLQISGVCEGDQVSVRGAREFTPLYFDYDVVETNNKRAFVEGALFLRYNDSVTADPTYSQKALVHETRMREQLLGDKAREFGKSTKRLKTLSEGFVRRSGLNSKSYNRIRFLGRTSS
jgi:hypothetical protein